MSQDAVLNCLELKEGHFLCTMTVHIYSANTFDLLSMGKCIKKVGSRKQMFKFSF